MKREKKFREILFRGKVKEDTEACGIKYFKGQWVYGSLCVNEPVSIIPLDRNVFIEVIPESIGQFTRDTDKYDKKIFEGDTVKYGSLDENGEYFHYRTKEVKWEGNGWNLSVFTTYELID